MVQFMQFYDPLNAITGAVNSGACVLPPLLMYALPVPLSPVRFTHTHTHTHAHTHTYTHTGDDEYGNVSYANTQAYIIHLDHI